MLPGDASVITAAIASPCSANAASRAATSLYGRTIVSPALEAGHPGGVRQGERRQAAAGGGEQGVDVAVVAARRT